MKVMTKMNSCIEKISMSEIIRVSRHIEREKALRERAAEIFKNDEVCWREQTNNLIKIKIKEIQRLLKMLLLTVKMIF